MAFTFIAVTHGATTASDTTVDTNGSLNVAAGDLLVAWVKHEGTPTTLAVAKTTGGNSFTFDAGDKVDHSNGDLSASFGYLLSASADATFTGRFTVGAARTFKSIIIWQFRPDSGETVTKDQSNTGQGNGTAVASGNITTTGTDEVVCGGYGEYVGATTSAHQIGGVNATGVNKTDTDDSNFTASWYRILSATMTNGNATCTAGGIADWIGNIISFSSAAGGGGGATIEPFTQYGYDGMGGGRHFGSRIH